MLRIHRVLIMASFFLLPWCAQAHDIQRRHRSGFVARWQHLRLLVRSHLSCWRHQPPERVPAFDPGAPEPRRGDFVDSISSYLRSDVRLPKPQVIATRSRFPRIAPRLLRRCAGPRYGDPAGYHEYLLDQTMLDVIRPSIQSERSRFSIHPGLARLGLRVMIALRFLPSSGVVRAFEFDGDPGLVSLDPRWHQAALRFVGLGFLHILSGTDHLLFIFCLVIPFRRLRTLIPVVTAFTVAHSITLIASAYNFAPDFLWFPPLIETLIAASIVYMALENIAGAGSAQRRWMMAFGFGLVHGFGFSFVLRQSLQFAGSHLFTSLLSFNVGVELGQLLVLMLLIPVLQLFFRFAVAERIGIIILSALVAHTAWHWMLDRFVTLRQFRFEWPALDAVPVAMALRWLMSLLILAGVLWLFQSALRWWNNRTKPEARASAHPVSHPILAPTETSISVERPN